MSSINRVFITGNLIRDPELRTTASGSAVLSFGVAVVDSVKNQQTGEWEDRPNWVDCTLFGSRAQAISGYLHKGSKVAIDGRLHWSQWERNGEKRSKLEVIINDIQFLSPREGAQSAPQQPQYQQPAPTYQQTAQQPLQQPQTAPQYASASVYDEDIPF